MFVFVCLVHSANVIKKVYWILNLNSLKLNTQLLLVKFSLESHSKNHEFLLSSNEAKHISKPIQDW